MSARANSGNSNSSPSSRTRSINSIPIEYNVKMDPTTCDSFCAFNFLISCVLFMSELCVEYLIILQWIHNQYYMPLIALFTFILLSNLCALLQWYLSFPPYSTFKLRHFIAPLALIGLLPFVSVIHYLCYVCGCDCARIALPKRKSLFPSTKSYASNDVSELLLPDATSHGSLSPIAAMDAQLLSNAVHLFISQAFLRMIPFVCITLFVWITVGLKPTNLLQDATVISVHIPPSLDALLTQNDSDYYVAGIVVSLVTYAFITVMYLDRIPTNQSVQYLQILFIGCDCILRSVPLILALYCDTFHGICIGFGLQVIWCLEVCFWYEIYAYFPEFPMRKIYPITYRQVYNGSVVTVASRSSDIDIPMQSQRRLSIDSDSEYRYQNPQYISNATVLSPATADSANKAVVWVPESEVEPTWALAYEEYIALCHGLLGGTLSCVSGWLIARSMRHCVDRKQYTVCVIELMIRYIASAVLVGIYCSEYTSTDSKHRIWPLMFVGCLLCVMPYIVVVYSMFRPKYNGNKK